MTTASTPAPGFRQTVFILLKAARQRADGRKKRARELLRQRTGRKTSALQVGCLGVVIAFLVGVMLHGFAAFFLYMSVTGGLKSEQEATGKFTVSTTFRKMVVDYGGPNIVSDSRYNTWFRYEARNIAREEGGSSDEIETQLRNSVRAHGARDLSISDPILEGLGDLPQEGPLPAMLGSIVLLWWLIMVVFQGEGLEADLQRRRHPMWEWLLSHPVQPGAVFLAEMLAPFAANPIYTTAPVFVGIIYGLAYGWVVGLVAGLVVGIPVAVAAACLGKALEIAIVLRFAPRTRGAIVGFMSWIGYASMMLFFLGAVSLSKQIGPIVHFLRPLAVLPWPWLGLFLGEIGRVHSYLLGFFICWCGAVAITAIAVGFSAWGANKGLSGNFGRASSAPISSSSRSPRFGKDPLYRKELLWFERDRSAVVQAILIPATIGGFQLFNMRGLIAEAGSAWNYLSGAAILFGTYFLWILGPRSLASEGPALWISLTWPRGLESLLKAKAWLWAILSSVIVVLVLLYAAWLYPRDAWKVALVGVGWMLFGRSMAEKSVTLVRAASESGEMERPSRNRQWGASLGMLTFAIGVITQQWHIAIMGIVYSYITAAAMWENFRARLPYLYDPWSEKIPPPPTLMHAMIAISILVELGAVFTGGALAAVGRDNIAIAQVIAYGICAFIVSLCTWWFLQSRGVRIRDVWCWFTPETVGQSRAPWWCGDGTLSGRFLLALGLGLTGGVALGVFGRGYLLAINQFPTIAEMIHQSQQQLTAIPGLHWSYAIIAVFFAPFAEEYLFRGLLYRALDREWGGWRAIVGSACFFAIYHPVLSWLPVSLLGATNAFLFKKTGHLAPCVVLHMVYNAVVVQ